MSQRRPISVRKRWRIYQACGYRCAYCGRGPAEIKPCWSDPYAGLELDHVLPLSRGGTNHEQNLVAACSPCNRAKGAGGWPR